MTNQPSDIKAHAPWNPGLLQSFRFRSIGPHRGGRTIAVAGHPHDPLVFYFGGSGSGVWKTHDGGVYWSCVSDGFLNTGPVGAIAVSDSDPNVIYVGTGEACSRPDVSHGDGVYKSVDGGQSWRHLGLEATRHISRIRIHPKNPNVVYVAAQGHLFGHNPERGVYRSQDGGETWELVLFKSEEAGAIDLSLDPTNPRILYASIFHFLREPWEEVSGGPDSGLYKSTDGGDTWVELSDNAGLPSGIKGRIGVAVSPARPQRVWALVEAEAGGLFRSDNGGDSWELVTGQRDLRRSASSYHHIFAHPQDEETLYVLSYSAWKSTDGGKTFDTLAMPHGDHHDLWIDPRNPRRMIEGNDGGATITLNDGATWSSIYNQPTHSFFHLAVDNQFPYHVYGTPMDNSAICVPSRTFEAAIPWKDCYPVGGSESGHIVVMPENPNVVIAGAIGSSPGGGGNLLRYDHSTGQSRIITVWPEDQYGSALKDVKYRFPFTYPVALSPHDQNVLYVAANRVFKSTNQGASWETISPDLTTQDESKMQDITGGLITSHGLSSQYSSVIYAFAESRREAGVLWAGTDDRQLHLSKDGGETWQDVSPTNLPRWTCISTIEPSPHDPGTVYVAAHRYKLDDHRPFLLKTTDYGASWQMITSGIRRNDFARVIREDPSRPGLLYAGTETGVYVSINGGETWQPMKLNLPAVAVHDMHVKDGDLVLATHGRGFWILDNLSPLRQLSDEALNAPAHLFRPPDTYRVNRPLRWSSPTQPGKNYDSASGAVVTYDAQPDASGKLVKRYLDGGENPPFGVAITYHLGESATGGVTLSIMDEDGNEIRCFAGNEVPTSAGMNRFVWDMLYPNAQESKEGSGLTPLENPTPRPPLAPPGVYQVKLAVGDVEATQSFEVLIDPRIEASSDDLQAQFDLHQRILEVVTDTNAAIDRLKGLRRQVNGWAEKAKGSEGEGRVSDDARAINQKLDEVEPHLTRVIGPNPMNLPPKGLDAKLAALTSVVSNADFAPTRQAYDVFEELKSRVNVQLAALEQVETQDLPRFQSLLRELNVPLIA